jgi:uncharacterized phage protein (TIGR02218 family)
VKEFSVETYDLLLTAEMSPVELMWVYLDGDTTPSHRYGLATRKIAFGGFAHTPLSWKRGAVKGAAKTALDKVDIQIDNVNAWFSTLATQRPLDGTRVKLIRCFQETWEDSDNLIVIFDGRIQSMTFDSKHAVVEIVSHMSFLNRPCPGRLFMPQCNYRLGSTRCGVDLAAVSTGTIAGGSGSSSLALVNASLTDADNFWAFGYVEIVSGDYKGLRRPVRASSSANTSVYLRYPFPISLEGVNVKVVPGCHKTKAYCNDTYANLLNFGGFAEVPRRPLIPVSR